MKLDILVTAAHPDDAELGCGGTIISHVEMGKKVGIADFTRGEMSTRGTPEIRDKEAEAAGKILGLSVRENLGFADVFFKNDDQHCLELIKIIRRYKPQIVLASAIHDRHPDHQKCAELTVRACFLSGLQKIETLTPGLQDAWRPKAVYHYIQDRYIKPDFVVDITPFWEKKLEALKTFKSQFYNPASDEPETYISQKGFLEYLEARAMEMGHAIGVKYGEGFTTQKQIGIKSLFDLV
ncbi:MAG: bacillithiol biosynthesis deacetylase BshB1 [Cytophagales bacterium]|nr:bacillithiol biosynthesis deacetylase BshB1 [Cytophagales bacterium]